MIKISVKSNFTGTKLKTDSILLEDENPGLMSALVAIESVMQVKLVNVELGEIYPDITVTVNDVDSNFLPERLATRLSEGDILGVSFITMGGG
ncbi:MAG: hypothetical protein WBG50_09800 [Desulfomonilaceae bacterium]